MFILLLFDTPLSEAIIQPEKAGYWFTLTLFEYYILYIIITTLCKGIKNRIWYDISLLAFGLITYLATFKPEEIYKLIGANPAIFNALEFSMFKYFIFFLFGIITKRNFQVFKNFIDNAYKIGTIIFLFLVLSLIYLKIGCTPYAPINVAFLIFAGIAGIIVTFSFFYKYQDSFTKETKVGRVLQCIGKRTLDIYLLHHFFLPRNLKIVGEWFTENINPTLEFFVSLTLAAMVIALCLVVSNVIRISPFLANWLFGVKIQK